VERVVAEKVDGRERTGRESNHVEREERGRGRGTETDARAGMLLEERASIPSTTRVKYLQR